MHINIDPVKGLNTGVPSLVHNVMTLILAQGRYRCLQGHNWKLVVIKPLWSIYNVARLKQLSVSSFI